MFCWICRQNDTKHQCLPLAFCSAFAEGGRGAVPRRGTALFNKSDFFRGKILQHLAGCSFCMGADSQEPASCGNGRLPRMCCKLLNFGLASYLSLSHASQKESKNFNLLLNQSILSWWQTWDFDHLQFRICLSERLGSHLRTKAAYAMNGAGNVSPIAAEVTSSLHRV